MPPPLIAHRPEPLVPPAGPAKAPPPQGKGPPPPPPPSPVGTKVVRRGGTPFIVTLLLVGATAGAGYYGWTHPAPPELLAGGPQPGQGAQIDQVKAELQAQIQAQIQAGQQAAASAGSQAGTAAAGQAVGPLHDQIAALADRVDKLEKATPPAPAVAPDAAPAPAPAPLPAGASAEEVTSLGQHVDQLSAKIEALSARQDAAAAAPAPAPAPAPDHAAMDAAAGAQAQVAALGGRLDQLEQAQKTALAQAEEQQKTALDQQKSSIDQQAEQQKAALAQTVDQQKAVIDALTARLEKLEQGTGKIESEADMAAKAARADGLLAALNAGKPLGDIPDAPPALAKFATVAPPTEDALRNAFPEVAAKARAASRPEDQQHSFWSRALARMQQTVVVRQGDKVIVGDPAAGVLARATDDVNRGDLPAAVQAPGALQGPAAQAVAGWVAQVRSLLEARAALSAMAAVH